MTVNKLNLYEVYGEYGAAGRHIKHNYYAQSPENAKKMFAKRIKRDYPYIWERMGFRNIHVNPIKKLS